MQESSTIQIFNDGMQLLGGAIGSNQFQQHFATQALSKARGFFKTVLETEGIPVQHKHILMRVCGLGRVTYLARCMPHTVFNQAVQVTGGPLHLYFYSLFSIGHENIGDIDERICTLPHRKGGTGWLDCTEIAPLAFLASCVMAQKNLQGLGTCQPWMEDYPPERSLASAFQRAKETSKDLAGPMDLLRFNKPQKRLSEDYFAVVLEQIKACLDTRSESHPLETARQRSILALESSFFLTSLPSRGELCLSDSQMITAVRFRLGQPLPGVPESHLCQHCQASIAPPDGSHAFSCKGSAGVVTRRHTELVNTWQKILFHA